MAERMQTSAMEQGKEIQVRKRGRPRGSCKPPAPPAPLPWKIRVHLYGKFRTRPNGEIVYDGGITAYIHIRDRAKFDYVELCRAVMGRLTGPRKQGMLWYLNQGMEIPEGLFALQNDEDMVSMWLASEALQSNESDVYTQDTGMVYDLDEDEEFNETIYTIPAEIVGMKWWRKVNFEQMWVQLLVNEGRDEVLVAAGGVKNWCVSWSPEARNSTLRVGATATRVFYDIPFFYKLM